MAKSIFHPRMLGYTGGDYTVESHFGQVSDVFGMDEVQCTGDEDYIWRCPHESTDDCSGGEGFGVICYNGGRNFLLNSSQITRQPDHKMIFLSTKSEQNFNVWEKLNENEHFDRTENNWTYHSLELSTADPGTGSGSVSGAGSGTF